MNALDDVLAKHGVGVRPLYRVIDLLRTGDHDLGELVRLSTAPRRSVEDVLAALGDDLDRSGDRLRISPGVAASYLQYSAPRYADPLDEAVATHELLPKVAEWVAEVPSPLAALDHVQATPETVLRRALWLDARYDLASARLLFLGDHDLTSLAVRAVCPSAELTVVDLDERVLAYLDERGGREIRTVHTDLRVGLPPALGGGFDLVFSDPPYTPEGMGLFAARGVQALREPSEGRLLFAYGYSPRHPALGAQVQRSLATLGLTFEAILPGFNRYFGAQAIGSAADLYVCQPTAKAKKMRGGKGKSAIYTHGPQSVEAAGTKPALLEKLREIAVAGGLSLESRPVDWSISGPEGRRDRDGPHRRPGPVAAADAAGHERPAARAAAAERAPGPRGRTLPDRAFGAGPGQVRTALPAEHAGQPARGGGRGRRRAPGRGADPRPRPAGERLPRRPSRAGGPAPGRRPPPPPPRPAGAEARQSGTSVRRRT